MAAPAEKKGPSLAILFGGKPGSKDEEAAEGESDSGPSDDEYKAYAETIFDDQASTEDRTKALKQFVAACMS
jgi:hypothetical protein